jgi:hypothetical protein
MYDAELMAVATGAAGTLVAAIASSGAERVRSKIEHFFRRATPDQQRAIARAVDDTTAQLATPSLEAQTPATATWAQLIAEYLTQHRDAIHELNELGAPVPLNSNVWRQHNSGAGTFIGGDVHGGLTFNYGGAQDGEL